MAYDSSNETRNELAKIRKNDKGDHIVITEITNNNTGTCNIDIRLYYTNEEDGELRPTQKGVRFNAEYLEEIIEALNKAVI